MKSSTYLIRVTRALVLGAVIAGTAASAASASVGRPPDVRDAATSASTAIPDAFERYVTAHPYGSQSSPVDRIVAQERGRHADPGLFSVGLSSTHSTLVSRPPDISDAAQAVETRSLGHSSGFDWGDWAVGIGTGIGLVMLFAGLLAGARQRGQRVQAA